MIIPYLQGGLEQELNWINFLSGEKCGVSGAIGIENAVMPTLYSMGFQIHRGPAGGGLVTYDGNDFIEKKGTGHLLNTFSNKDLNSSELRGKVAIGHNRYATTGDGTSERNIQPLPFDTPYGKIWIAHNGNLTPKDKIIGNLENRGVSQERFMTDSDSEWFGHYIASSKCDTLEEAVIETSKAIPSAYNFLVMTENKIIGARDRFGVRPLFYGSMGAGGHFISSENYFYNEMVPFPIRDMREVPKGSIIVLEEGKKARVHTYDKTASMYFCLFEILYFSSALTSLPTPNGWIDISTIRKAFGAAHLDEIRDWIDIENSIAVPLLGSGEFYAKGFAEAAGIPYKEGIAKLSNPFSPPRGFLDDDGDRNLTLGLKHHPKKHTLDDKDIFLFDDHICRGHTTHQAVSKTREVTNPKSIHLRIGGAPTVDGCVHGTNLEGVEELIYPKYGNADDVASAIRVDSVRYNPFETIDRILSDLLGFKVCMGCYGGRDPTRRPD